MRNSGIKIPPGHSPLYGNIEKSSIATHHSIEAHGYRAFMLMNDGAIRALL